MLTEVCALFTVAEMICTKLAMVLYTVAACQACITLLDNKWRPHTIEDRAAVAEVVISTRTLSKFPIPNSRMRLYGANFEVLSILKGWSKIEELLEKGSPSVQEGEKLTVSALGFGDRRHCWSSVDIGETYILFLSVNNVTGYLVAKYLGAFGAAELLYAPSEDAILLSLGMLYYCFCGTLYYSGYHPSKQHFPQFIAINITIEIGFLDIAHLSWYTILHYIDITMDTSYIDKTWPSWHSLMMVPIIFNKSVSIELIVSRSTQKLRFEISITVSLSDITLIQKNILNIFRGNVLHRIVILQLSLNIENYVLFPL